MSALKLFPQASLCLTASLILIACTPPPVEEKITPPPIEHREPASTIDINKPPRVFLKCRSCHAYEAGKVNAVGPNLVNVFGNPAGADPNYTFSRTLTESGIVWNREALDAFLAKPSKTIPGTKMAFIGLKKEEERAEIIKWMETLNAED